jgi:hypothetical protein
MLRDAMSFSNRTDKVIRSMETMIDELSWGIETTPAEKTG